MNITWENYELIESAPNNQKQALLKSIQKKRCKKSYIMPLLLE